MQPSNPGVRPYASSVRDESFRSGRSPGGSLLVLGGGILRTRSTLLAIGMMALDGLVGWLATPTVGQEHQAQPGAKSEPAFTPAQLAECATHRRADEAVIWGMPAVNYRLIFQEMVRKTKGGFSQVLYWSRVLDWKNPTLTPNPDV